MSQYVEIAGHFGIVNYSSSAMAVDVLGKLIVEKYLQRIDLARKDLGKDAPYSNRECCFRRRTLHSIFKFCNEFIIFRRFIPVCLCMQQLSTLISFELMVHPSNILLVMGLHLFIAVLRTES